MTVLGSGVRSPLVLRGLARHHRELALNEVVLHDVDRERLKVMTVLGADLCREWGASFTVRGEPDALAALEGSQFVFSAIRVGQEPARAIDEELPLKHGVLGQETTGPGGFAMAMRTIPVMLDYARLIEEVSPEALLVNFTNPVGIVMQALADHSSVRAVGICDGPVSMKRSIAGYLGVPGDEVYVDYFGLNHCGWIHRVLVEGRDRLPEILGSYEGLQRVDESWRLFDADLVRSIGMLPMEYLFFYYYREQAVDHVLRSGDTRGGQIAKLSAELWPVLHDRVEHDDIPGARRAWERAMDQRGSTYFARERGETVSERPHADDPSLGAVEGEGYEGVATAVMLAAVQRDPTPLILNVPNRGAVPSLGDRDVVEVTCLADQHGARPIAQGAIPDHAIALLEHVKLYERLTVDAAVRGSYDSALRALLVHPLVGSYPVARSILEDYLTRHDGLMPPLR